MRCQAKTSALSGDIRTEGRRITGGYSECANLKLEAHVEFFPKDSAAADALLSKDSRPAGRVYDDCLGDAYIFIWRIGMEGRLRLTFEAPSDLKIPLDVQKVVMRIGRGAPYEMQFVQSSFERRGRESMQIDVALSAVDPILTTPSPFWGNVKKRYLPLNFIITAECRASELRSIDTFIKTVYCHVRRERKPWLSFLTQTTSNKTPGICQSC